MLYLPYILSQQKREDIDIAVESLVVLNRKRNNTPVNTDVLRSIFERLLEHVGTITVVVESHYVDKVYRDSYYKHYATKHFSQSRYCARAFLFQGVQEDSLRVWDAKALQATFIGTIVVQPTQHGIVGRTFLNPCYLFPPAQSPLADISLRVSKYSVLLHGTKLTVNAFPYMMQDAETMSCAEVSLSILMEYFSNQYQDYRTILPSDIYAVSQRHGFERVLPTRGMTYSMITRALTNFGFHPRMYVTSGNLPSHMQKRILHYYVESAIPVIMEVKRANQEPHSIVCIGHGKSQPEKLFRTLHSVSFRDRDLKPEPAANDAQPSRFYFADTADAYDDYIVMDDGESPYSQYSFTEKADARREAYLFQACEIEALLIPLYKRMFLEAEDAFAICREVIRDKNSILANAYQKHYGTKRPPIGTEENPLIIRLFMASSRSFRSFRVSQLSPTDSMNAIYRDTPFPKFVWVCEHFDRKGYLEGKALGEIVLDATSSSGAQINSIILLNALRVIFMRHFDGRPPRSFFCDPEQDGQEREVLEQEPSDNPEERSFMNWPALHFYRLKRWKPFPAYRSNLTELGEL